MARSAPVRANKHGRKNNNRMWAEKRRLVRGGTVVAGAGQPATPLDISKAIYRPGAPAAIVVPPGGTTQIVFTGWENPALTASYHTLTGGKFSGWTYSANYLMEVSIKCSLTGGAGAILGVEVWINNVPYQEIICQGITALDERHNGETAISVVATPSDVVDVRLSDPSGVGYNLSVEEVYCNFTLGDRQ